MPLYLFSIRNIAAQSKTARSAYKVMRPVFRGLAVTMGRSKWLVYILTLPVAGHARTCWGMDVSICNKHIHPTKPLNPAPGLSRMPLCWSLRKIWLHICRPPLSSLFTRHHSNFPLDSRYATFFYRLIFCPD